MMFQSQLIKSIENIQRKSEEMSILFGAKKQQKKIRKGEVQKIRVKNKKQEKKRESFCDLTRVYVCVSLLCLEVCALVKIRARVCTCVCLLCSS